MPLWLVATPIGTLGDLSPRAREILGSSRAIACEDTRHTRQLLSALGIPAPQLIALHAHNEESGSGRVLDLAMEADVAVVSDAGTPGVSDPGEWLVSEAHSRGVEVRSVPGPSALASALAASGLPAQGSWFLGFPPRKGREAWVKEALRHPGTLVVYEAPSRIADLVGEFAQFAPERQACLCREISKKFEENVRAVLSALASTLSERTDIRGECVLVVGPGEPLVDAPAPLAEDAGMKAIASSLAERCGVTKKEAYAALVALERKWRE